MDQVRLGIIGIGNMGSAHLAWLAEGKVKRMAVTAICDTNPEKLAKHPQYKGFADSRELIRSGLVDAVLVATPHYDHTTIGIDALGQGLHVLVEKPLSVHKADCEKLIAAYEKRPKPGQLFAAMFNQRTDPRYIKVRELIKSGELGEIRRVNWIITDWYRTQSYYNSGGWRATWRGEGGGVLINQCPHNLDLMQWMFGLPVSVRGFAGLGKWHDIEVEDSMTAYLEFPNGATGVFITSTGETPGTNRLEITAERGKVVVEGGSIRWTRNTVPMSEHCKTSPDGFSRPDVWNVDVPSGEQAWGGQHVTILNNFAEAILDGKALIAQAPEGIRSVELGNAMLLSSLLDRTLSLPLDSAMVRGEFDKLIAKSKYVKPQVQAAQADMLKSAR